MNSQTKASIKETTHWEVRFQAYRYNSGRGDNGHIEEVREFTSLEEAVKFLNRLEAGVGIDNSHQDWVDDELGYACGGFIETIHGVFKVEATETKIL